MNDLEPMRVALMAGENPVFLELERSFLAHSDVQLERFRAPEPFLEHLEDDTLPAPNLVVLEADDALRTFEAVRGLERGAVLPVLLLRANWRPDALERAWSLKANSCLRWPDDQSERLRFWDELTAYWCRMNEASPV